MKKFKINDMIIYAFSLKDAIEKYKMSVKDKAIHEEHGVCDIWMNSTNKAYAIGGIRHFNKKWNESGLREYAKEVLESADFIKKLEAQGYKLDTDKAYRDSLHDDELDDLSDEERQAIEDYRLAIKNTTNPKLLELYAHILQEETEHLKELESAKEI